MELMKFPEIGMPRFIVNGGRATLASYGTSTWAPGEPLPISGPTSPGLPTSRSCMWTCTASMFTPPSTAGAHSIDNASRR